MNAETSIARWIRRELATEALHAPSLIVTIWGDTLAPVAQEVWLSTIVRLLRPFGVNERAVRTAVFRLHRAGWLAPRPLGRRSRYALTETGTESFERAFHRVYDPPFLRWDGLWDGVVVRADGLAPAQRRHVREELGWAGYGRFGDEVFFRPARGDEDAGRIAARLHLEDRFVRFTARDRERRPEATLASRVETVWSLGALENEYRRFLARFSTLDSAMRSGAADDEQAFIVRTLLVHAYRRVRLRDPQLPREVLGERWPGASAYAAARSIYRTVRLPADRYVGDVLSHEGEDLRRRMRGAARRFA